MPRQSISFTLPNDQWLKAQGESQEYSSKSEVINDLVRRAREVEATQARLIHAEGSGFTELSQDEILKQAEGSLALGSL